MIAEDDGANRRAGGDRDRAEGFRPRGSNVCVEGAGGGVRGLVRVARIGGGDGAVRPRLITRKKVKLGLDNHRGDAVLGVFIGGTSLTSGTDPAGRRTLAAGGVGVRKRRCATTIAARASTELSQPLRTMTAAIRA